MYRVVLGSLPPLIITLFDFLFMMVTSSSSNCAMHPLSQKIPIDRRALLVRSGKMCASLAFKGRSLF